VKYILLKTPGGTELNLEWVPHTVVEITERDVSYLLALARRDVKYLRGRMERRGHEHNMPQRDPDATKAAKRSELVDKLERLLQVEEREAPEEVGVPVVGPE